MNDRDKKRYQKKSKNKMVSYRERKDERQRDKGRIDEKEM